MWLRHVVLSPLGSTFVGSNPVVVRTTNYNPPANLIVHPDDVDTGILGENYCEGTSRSAIGSYQLYSSPYTEPALANEHACLVMKNLETDLKSLD